ncbi:MAG: tRNA pseudouridine(54/55) synthase Pus10 [Thermoplasmatales archaeon]
MAACPICHRRLDLEGVSESLDRCDYCGGLLTHVDDFYEMFRDISGQFEINSFLIGVRVEPEKFELDNKIIAEKGLNIRDFKKEFECALGSRIEDRLGLKADFKFPDAVFTVDQRNMSCDLWIRPVYIVGRYIKKARGIPQSPWISPARGREGKSISEYIGEAATSKLSGRNYNFYASGREDVDALMLGSGRPFYVEVTYPRRRSFDGAQLSEAVRESSGGKVEIFDLRIASVKEVDELKKMRFNKIYEVRLTIDRKVDGYLLQRLSSYSGSLISQRTPSRVLPIRSDIIRKRKIYSVKVSDWSDNQVTLRIEAEAGTYIKEFITGDSGRTEPSISDDLKVNVKIDYLNVLQVK